MDGRYEMQRWTGAWLGLAACLLAAGCGGSTKTVVQTVTAPASSTASTTTPSTATSSSTSDNCNAKGINGTALGEGTCHENGTVLTVANKDSVLRLRSLTAKLNGIHVQNSLSANGGSETATANGVFVIVSLTITNRLDTPQTFDSIGTPQTGLSLGKRLYTEDFKAENGPDQQSFIAGTIGQNGIQPGESKTGDVVFDAPRSAVSDLSKSANLYVVNFGENVSNTTSPIGIFRTYH